MTTPLLEIVMKNHRQAILFEMLVGERGQMFIGSTEKKYLREGRGWP